jgi:hypothetical protein
MTNTTYQPIPILNEKQREKDRLIYATNVAITIPIVKPYFEKMIYQFNLELFRFPFLFKNNKRDNALIDSLSSEFSGELWTTILSYLHQQKDPSMNSLLTPEFFNIAQKNLIHFNIYKTDIESIIKLSLRS